MLRWKKRLFCLLAVLSLCAALCLPAIAENRYVYDEAGILTESERAVLESQAAEISGEYGCAVYIVTKEYVGGDIRDAAESMFRENGFGLGAEDSGVLLLLSMEDRDYALIAHGYGDTAFTEYDKDGLEKAFLDDFGRDDWYQGFADYISYSGTVLSRAQNRAVPGVNEDAHPSFFRGLRERLGPFGLVIVIVVLPALIALIVCTVVKRNMKNVRKAVKADFFAIPGSMEIYASVDRFTHITETRAKVESDDSDNRGGGGGGFSGRSGKF